MSAFNVYPNEIEAVIAAHPKVLEAGVIGVADPNSGEAVVAIVVKADQTLSKEELRVYCHENMTGYKCTKTYRIC